MTHKTNVQKINDLMNFGPNPLVQPFIIEAIIRYAKETMQAQPWPDTFLIDFDAWKSCAEGCLRELAPDELAKLKEGANV